MNGYPLPLPGADLLACPTGALWWPAERVLTVSDLHLGRSERYARNGGALLPPYEVMETLSRLDADIAALSPRTVICLGDSFDDIRAADLTEEMSLWLTRLMAGRRWVWIEGNHDPGPLGLGGEHRAELALGPLTFRHIAVAGATGEVSGHYHPKVSLAGRTRPAFLADTRRIILPAYGTYTGGLKASAPELRSLMSADALAIVTGPRALAIPMPG
jgi:DNA ligase-associated metallophosphoesterase